MEARWGYEGVKFRHTEAEIDDPDCHLWQGPVAADEFIIHAANLHMYRTGAKRVGPDGEPLPSLWSVSSLSRRANLFVEPKVPAR